jgi:tRNA A37 N6-isopentenylltransferase MiaA
MKRFFMAALLLTTLAGSVKAQNDSTNYTKAEKLLSYVLNNQTDSLYDNLSDKVKGMVNKEQLNGVAAQAEDQFGKYKSHTPWNTQTVMGIKGYVSTVSYEKAELGALIIMDEDGKALGVQIVPLDALMSLMEAKPAQ